MNDIAAIKARREAITPGVWQTYRRHMVGFPADEYVHVECGGELIADCGPADVEQAHADATFIAAAPADIDTLLAEVEWLTGEVERMRLSWAMGLIQLLPPDEKAQAVTKAANAVAALTAKLDAANEEITAMSWDIAGLRYYIHALERYVPEVARRVAAGEARAQLEQQGGGGMNAEQLKQYEELAAGALLLGRDRHASAIMAPIAEVERLQRELQQAQAQLAGGKPEPTAEENGAAEFRVKRIGELYTQFGNNRDTWPQWAQDVFARLSGAQNEYEAKYC